jgi:hypothetical protein
MYQFIDIVTHHKSNPELKEIIIKSVDCYTEKEWVMIFKNVKFNTVELLKLEDYALKNIETVCENQNITEILRERWKDQKGFSNELHTTPLRASLVNPYGLTKKQSAKKCDEGQIDNLIGIVTPTQVRNNLVGCHSCCKKEKKKSIKRKNKKEKKKSKETPNKTIDTSSIQELHSEYYRKLINALHEMK